jgi:hypothetical protein
MQLSCTDHVLRLRRDRWSEGAARVALELGLQASSFDRAAQAYQLAVGSAMSADSIRNISAGEGAKLLALRAAEVAPAHDLQASSEPTLTPHDPITAQANLSTDGVLTHLHRGVEGSQAVRHLAGPPHSPPTRSGQRTSSGTRTGHRAVGA